LDATVTADHDGLRRAQGRSDQDHQIDEAQYQAARAYQEGLRSIDGRRYGSIDLEKIRILLTGAAWRRRACAISGNPLIGH
jgi:hypothetical protein